MSGNVININDFDYNIIKCSKVLSRPKGKHKPKKSKTYRDLVCAFDIETTRLKEINQSFMYIWQFQIDEYYTIIGRTWEEFLTFLMHIEDILQEDKIVVYVHNLSYEAQFLQGIWDFQPQDVFCLKSRVVLKMDMGPFEFRCSYKLTNMSLSEYTHKMGVESPKQFGFDYSKIRYPWTPLTEDELLYCINDVKGLVQALKTEMEIEHNNLYDIPLTSTGYVRQEAKQAMRHFPKQEIKKMLPNYDVYKMLRRAFRGGDTHANRYYAGDLIKGPVYSYDRASSYPHVQCTQRFPMGVFRPLKSTELYSVMDLIERQKKAVICDIAIYNYKLADRYFPNPPLSLHKCRNVKLRNKRAIERGEHGTIIDNGRILETDYLETTVTDIDLKILYDTTSPDSVIEIKAGYFTHYGYLPKPFREVILKYYVLKSELKKVQGQEIYYMKSKNKLNSFYGMSATNPVREIVKYFDGAYYTDISEFQGEDDLPNGLEELLQTEQEQLDKYNQRAFMPYQWGVWTTALARYELYKMQKLVYDSGAELLYWDTDSVKYKGYADFTEYNENIKKQDIAMKAYVDVKGKRYYLGVAELDGEYRKFKTLGAKKYCVIKSNGRLELTCAGVNKAIGSLELCCYDGINSFEEGFVFSDAGGLEAKYNDESYGVIDIDGHKLDITRNVCLVPSEYTLGITGDYDRVISDSKNLLSFITRNS